MILCVTLNPCLDKTLTVPPWKPGDHQVRGKAVRALVGGKGNNVARALTRLGRNARPALFLGGSTGRLCEGLLRDRDRLDPIVVPTASETRVILTVRTEDSPEQTAFFDPDPAITGEEADALYRALDQAMTPDVSILTLSGSSPAVETHHLYSDLISLAKARRIPVFLDTYGPAFDAVWGFWPDVVQMNRREAAVEIGSDRRPDDEMIQGLLLDWARHGVQIGIVTDGPGPVLVLARGERFRIVPPRIDVVNPIGSGDCLLAGLADGWLSGLPTEDLLRHAVACAAANALTWDAGAIDLDTVRSAEVEVRVESLGRVVLDGAQGQLVRKTLGRKR